MNPVELSANNWNETMIRRAAGRPFPDVLAVPTSAAPVLCFFLGVTRFVRGDINRVRDNVVAVGPERMTNETDIARLHDRHVKRKGRIYSTCFNRVSTN